MSMASKTTEMTVEEASALERKSILEPESVTLPGGKSLADERRELLERHREEGRARREKDLENARAQSSATIKPGARVRVEVIEGRVVSAPAARKAEAAAEETVRALPEEFPHRELLTGAGFNTVEKVSAATDEELLAIDGLAGARVKEVRAALKKLK